jgi:hypothetical protein
MKGVWIQPHNQTVLAAEPYMIGMLVVASLASMVRNDPQIKPLPTLGICNFPRAYRPSTELPVQEEKAASMGSQSKKYV